ncbi:MAG: hypothetical protein RMI91_11465 [Gemmatales bacterium]|nr:hypothetical protein [Gemmatales bacterium]MDW7995262.1 hypothetical protein [Gemmatales bacterium]
MTPVLTNLIRLGVRYDTSGILRPFALLLLWLAVTQTLQSQEFRIRHIQLDPQLAEAELARHPQWTRVSREELEKVLTALQTRQERLARTPLILQAHYQAHWEESALVGQGHWLVWNPESLPLEVPSASLALALLPPVRINGHPAAVGLGARGELVFGLPMPKAAQPEKSGAPNASAEYRVEFNWSARWERRRGELLATLEIPPAQLTTLSLDIPATWRVALRGAEASLVNITPLVDPPNTHRYLWALGPNATRLELALNQVNVSSSPPLVYVRQQAEHVLDSGGWHPRYRLELETPDAGLPECVIILPPGLQVASLQERLRGLSDESWSQETMAQRTNLRLRWPGRIRRAELDIVCRTRPLVWDSSLQLGLAEVPNSAALSASMMLRWRPELALSAWHFGDFTPHHPPQFVQDGYWQLHLEQAVPRVLKPTRAPRVTVSRQKAEVFVHAEFVCHLGVSQSRMTAQLHWQIRSGSVFRLAMRLPTNWVLEDAQMLIPEDSTMWSWRREGQRVWAELQQGALPAPANVRMMLRLRSEQAQPDFQNVNDWPLPEIIPEQVSWAQGSWSITVDRVRDERGRRCLIGSLWPGNPWPLRPGSWPNGEPAKPMADYVFVGPIPSGARMRVLPVPSLYHLQVNTQVDLQAPEQTLSTVRQPRHLHVRWTAQVEPVCGLVRTVILRFPGEAPELDWQVVSGESRLQHVHRRCERHQDGIWTDFHCTFQTPLLGPVRLQADWLYPLQQADRPTDSSHSRTLAQLPLPYGREAEFCQGKLTVADAVPDDWWFAVRLAQASDQGSQLVTLNSLPWAYSQPSILEIFERTGDYPPAVIEGALVVLDWDGNAQLRGHYWAWTHISHNSSQSGHSESDHGINMRLRLPLGARLQSGNVVGLISGQFVRLADVEIEEETGELLFRCLPPGPVVFHVQFVQETPVWYCWARWPKCLPTWSDRVTVLAQRVLVRLPRAWSPISAGGKIRCPGTADALVATLAHTDLDYLGQKVVNWWHQHLAEAYFSSHPRTREVGGLLFSSEGFAWWELSQSSWDSPTIWVQRERAHALAALFALAIFLFSSVALQRGYQWLLVIGALMVFLASLIALIWLPPELGWMSLWILCAIVLVSVRAIRRATSVEPLTSGDLKATWFSMPSGWWWLWLTIAMSWATYSAFADQNQDASAKPSSPPKTKEPITVTVFHYTERHESGARSWVLVPLVWWQRWQEQLRQGERGSPWYITSSKWSVEVPELVPGKLNQGFSNSAQITWELDVVLLKAPGTIPLAVSGIRWQAIEVRSDNGEVQPANVIPSDSGLLVQLAGQGTHRLRLTGQADVQNTESEGRLHWKTQPLPFATLQAQLAGLAQTVELGQCRGRAHWRRIESPKNAATWTGQAELGPVSEITLTWQLPDPEPLLWSVEEFHRLDTESHELRWHVVSQFQVVRGRLNEIRLVIPEGFTLRSFEARAANGQSISLGAEQLSKLGARHIATIPFLEPARGTFTLLAQYTADPRVTSLWWPWQKLLATYSLLAPMSLFASGQLRALDQFTDQQVPRRKILVMRNPYILADNKTAWRGSWFVCPSDKRARVRVSLWSGAKPWVPTVEDLKRWPKAFGLNSESAFSSLTAAKEPAHFFQLFHPSAVFQIQMTSAVASGTVASTATLELDWYQAQLTWRAELHAEGDSLPVATVAQIPANLRIVDVTSEQLAEWQQEGNQLRLWFRPELSRTTLQIRGTISPSHANPQHTFSIPNVHFPALRALPARLELQASGRVRFRLLNIQGLTPVQQSESQATFHATGGPFSGLVEIQPVSGRYTAQLTSSWRRSPDGLWETQVDCRSNGGPIRQVVIQVRDWPGSPPRIVSEEFHAVDIQPLPEKGGYSIRVEFPESASWFDQSVRFRIMGRLPPDQETKLPLFSLPEAQQVRHRLMDWPREISTDQALVEGGAIRLPSEAQAAPVTYQYEPSRSSSVKLIAACLDEWYQAPDQRLLQFTAYLAHAPRTLLSLQLPASATLLRAFVNDRPVVWHRDADGAYRVLLVSSYGLSCLRLIFHVPAPVHETALPRLQGEPLASVWLQRWRPVSGELMQAEHSQAALQQQLALAESLYSFLSREAQLGFGDNWAALAQLANWMNDLLQAPKRVSVLTDAQLQRWQPLWQQWSAFTTSPRFEPIRRELSQPSFRSSPPFPKPIRPFLAAQAVGQRWSLAEAWPEEAHQVNGWHQQADAWFATVALITLTCVLIALHLWPVSRMVLVRFHPEIMLGLALAWAIFLQPRWFAAICAALGLYWRYRRWRAMGALIRGPDAIVVGPN